MKISKDHRIIGSDGRRRRRPKDQPAAGGGSQRIKGSTGRRRRLKGSKDQPAAEGGLKRAKDQSAEGSKFLTLRTGAGPPIAALRCRAIRRHQRINCSKNRICQEQYCTFTCSLAHEIITANSYLHHFLGLLSGIEKFKLCHISILCLGS